MEKTEQSQDHNSQKQTVISEPNFRLNVKKNFKGEIGYEYTVRGDTIEELSGRDTAMRGFIKLNIELK